MNKSESGLWLPGPARRRPKRGRPDSRDYKQVIAINSGELSYDGFIFAMREQWNDQYTAAERQGPITFEYYITLSLNTMRWRVSEDIPDSVRTGSIDSIEARVSIDFFQQLITYAERYLRLKGIQL